MTATRAGRFLAAHRPGTPLVMPNAWDTGSARVLAAVGCQAVATTSGGFAATLGRLDGSVTRDEAFAHAAALVAAVEVPVSADLENGFGDHPAAVAATVTAAVATGLAGCSIEDYSGDPTAPIYDVELAADRITAAVEANAGRLVLTARAENLLHGRDDLADTITRLQRYQQAGADVLYAPGLRTAADVRAVVTALDRPVNVLLVPQGPGVAELAGLGVARVSVGGALAYAALGALGRAVRDLLAGGAPSYWPDAAEGRDLIRSWTGDGG